MTSDKASNFASKPARRLGKLGEISNVIDQTTVWYYGGIIIVWLLFLWSLKSGGETWDEGVHFDSTIWQLDYARSVLWGRLSTMSGTHLRSFRDIFSDYAFYGIGTFGPAYVLSYAIDIGLLHQHDHLWSGSFAVILHVMSFSSAMLCMRYVRKCVESATHLKNVGQLAGLTLILTPYWLGYSYFDYKDIPVASALLVSTYYAFIYLKKRERSALTYFFLALLWLGAQKVAAVPLALPACLAVLYAAVRDGNPRRIMLLTLHGFAFIALLYAISPPAWREPISYFMATLDAMSHHAYPGCTVTAGECIGRNFRDGLHYSAAKYLAIWYGVQLPLGLWVALGFALMLLPRYFVRQRSVDARVLLLGAVIWPIAALVLGNSTLYNGVRHTLFLTPIVVVLIFTSISGQFIVKFRYILALYLAFLLIDIIKLQPYSYVWFNEPARFFASDKNYDTDYYGYAMKEMAQVAVTLQQPGEAVVGLPTHLVEPYIKRNMLFLANDITKVKGGTDWLFVTLAHAAAPANCRRIAAITRQELFSPLVLDIAQIFRCKS